MEDIQKIYLEISIGIIRYQRQDNISNPMLMQKLQNPVGFFPP